MRNFNIVWAKLVIRFRLHCIFLCVLMVGLSPLSFNGLYHDNSPESYFLPGDQKLDDFDRFVDLFGEPEYLVVAVSAKDHEKDVFSAGTLKVVDEITQYLDAQESVLKVSSLSKYEYTYNDGMLHSDEVIENIDAGALEYNKVRTIMASERIAKGYILSEDFRHTQIMARTEYKPGDIAHHIALVQGLNTFLDKKNYQNDGYRISLSGTPVVNDQFQSVTTSDMTWINPVIVLVLISMLYLVFRTPVAIFSTLGVLGLSILFGISIQGIFGWPFTAVNSAFIPATIILAVCNTVHMLVDYFLCREKGLSPPEAAEKSTAELFFPILFTCVTTAIGFFALSYTELSPVKEFGYQASLVTLVVFFMVLVFLPSVLSFIPWTPSAKVNANGYLRRRFIVNIIPNLTYKYRVLIACFGCGCVLVGVFGAMFVSVDSATENYFKQSNQFRQDSYYFNEVFGGSRSLELVVDSGEAGGVNNSDVLREVAALQVYLERFDVTGTSMSVVDFYKQIHKMLRDGDEQFFVIPENRKLAAQLLLAYENTGAEEDLSNLVDWDGRFIRITIPVESMSDSETANLLYDINAYLDREYSELDIFLTGSVVMSNAQSQYANQGMLKSFCIALLFISVCLFGLFRSWKYSFIAVTASITPILLTASIVSALGISLDLGTMLVGAMTLGIAVDDSVHMLCRYLDAKRNGMSVDRSIVFAMDRSGRAIIFSSVILVLGFGVMLFGEFIPYIYVGAFSASIMGLALVSDLLFVPALLYIFDGKDERENVGLTEEKYA